MKNYSHRYISDFTISLYIRRIIGSNSAVFEVVKESVFYKITIHYEGFYDNTFYVDFDGDVLFYGFSYKSEYFKTLVLNGKI